MYKGNPQKPNINKNISLIPLTPKFLLYLNSYVLPKLKALQHIPKRRLGYLAEE